MEYKGPYCYTLWLSGSEEKRVLSKNDLEGYATTFKHPVTQNKTPKIYILKQEEEIVYVGYASQSIGTRLAQGIRASGLNGYHGYKWKQANELNLLVFVFDHTLQGDKDADKPYVQFAESVEAELVYLIREKTGQWPKFQNEIHFNNHNLQKAKGVAEEIYAMVNVQKNKE
ncbi:hypothetical protein J8L85_12555 [Maribacter sp. MMG018]|uniref:hypothetical protein n=1 Tax=Maribacter sp. MMG018 TaxID=2822688 RepID=UPI001B360834|nr:hypothetical protein [Maribacter sp. MMG018]MBQ4915275.1 hypothetical protein [Maribacter sp. MMG018]